MRLSKKLVRFLQTHLYIKQKHQIIIIIANCSICSVLATSVNPMFHFCREFQRVIICNQFISYIFQTFFKYFPILHHQEQALLSYILLKS